MSLVAREYQTINYISGPLVFVERAEQLSYNAMVKLDLPNGDERNGQVLEVSEDHAVIQVLERTSDLDVAATKIRLEEDVARLGVSVDMIGRVFNGRGVPIDGKPTIIPEKRLPITGAPINPVSRNVPDDFIQTGISTIDGFNTLVRGQKLPIFSGSGLPHNEMAGQILRQAQVLGGESFVIIFAAMGITQREASFFVQSFEESGATSRVVSFINLADDPTVERILTPRMALTTAEFFAYEKDMQVLVILTDMTNTPIVAMLVPQVTEWADRRGISPSRLLIPLSYAAIFGGIVTVIGTATNLVISGLLQAHGYEPIGLFELTALGLPLAVAGVVAVMLLAPLLLPERRPARQELEEELREYVVNME
ncbi:V-type ATP synthase subunit B, partial [Gemmatimonadota bacterium]